MNELVTLAEDENYCVITMDDGKANALGFDMLGGLNSALDEAGKTGKVVIITGRPGKFSAGFDLSVMARLDNDTALVWHTPGPGAPEQVPPASRGQPGRDL
jgi:enoyl-CoA hydratase/carnithine racemase